MIISSAFMHLALVCMLASGMVSTACLNVTALQKHFLPFSAFQPFLSMHQLCHLCSQPFVSQPLPRLLSLLLHQSLHLC